jgi:hypothetical protein
MKKRTRRMDGWMGKWIDGRGRRMKRRSSSRMDIWLDGRKEKTR